MSRERRVFTSQVAPYRKERGPNGRPLCRYCGQEVPAGRRTWCSQGCVTEAQVRAGDAGVICRELMARDHGICALCGADAGLAERVIERIVRRAAWRDPEASDCEWLIRSAWGRERFGGIRQLWEADHTIPVVEGGGGCGLDGYRTLCRPCHKAETAALARRRAEARNPNLRLQLAAEENLKRTGEHMAAGNQEGRVSEHDSKGLCVSGQSAGEPAIAPRPFVDSDGGSGGDRPARISQNATADGAQNRTRAGDTRPGWFGDSSKPESRAGLPPSEPTNRLECGGMGRCRVGWRQE